MTKHVAPGTDGIRFLAADMEVLRQYKGATKRTLRVWGGHGTDCQVPADLLPDGSTWFLALNALGADAKWYKGAEATDFYLAVCSKSLERVPDDADAQKALVGKIERSLNAR